MTNYVVPGSRSRDIAQDRWFNPAHDAHEWQRALEPTWDIRVRSRCTSVVEHIVWNVVVRPVDNLTWDEDGIGDAVCHRIFRELR